MGALSASAFICQICLDKVVVLGMSSVIDAEIVILPFALFFFVFFNQFSGTNVYFVVVFFFQDNGLIYNLVN